MRPFPLLAAVACLLTVGASAATGQSAVEGAVDGATQSAVRAFNDDKTWQTVTFADGCRAVMSTRVELETNWGPYDNTAWRWSGACDKDRMITGQGVLTIEFTTNEAESGLSGTRYRIERSGLAKSGFFDGRVSELTYSDADDFDSATPAGSLQRHNFGDARNPMPSFHRGGCSYPINDAGQPDMAPTGCDETRGVAYRNRISGKTITEGKTADAVAEAMRVAAEATGGQCANLPDRVLERFNAQIKALTGRYPLKSVEGPAGSGARAANQWTAFVATEGLRILETHRVCLGPHYEANKTQLETMRDTGLAACAGLSTTGQCPATYPY